MGGSRYLDRIEPKKIDVRFVSEYQYKMRDIEFIKLVYEMGAIRLADMTKMMGLSLITVRRMAKELYVNRFIDRKFEAMEYGTGTGASIYFLDDAGKICMASVLGCELSKIKWRKQDNNLGNIKICHTLEISTLRAVFMEECRKKGYVLKTWKTEKFISTQTSNIVADSYIEVADEKNKYKFYLEYDRGTMDVPSLKKKIDSYESIEGKPRVVFVTTTPKRATSIMDKLIKNVDVKNDYFITSVDLFQKNPFGDIWKNKNDMIFFKED